MHRTLYPPNFVTSSPFLITSHHIVPLVRWSYTLYPKSHSPTSNWIGKSEPDMFANYDTCQFGSGEHAIVRKSVIGSVELFLSHPLRQTCINSISPYFWLFRMWYRMQLSTSLQHWPHQGQCACFTGRKWESNFSSRCTVLQLHTGRTLLTILRCIAKSGMSQCGIVGGWFRYLWWLSLAASCRWLRPPSYVRSHYLLGNADSFF